MAMGFDLRPPSTRGGPDLVCFFFFNFSFRPEEATSFSTTPLEIAEVQWRGFEWRIFLGLEGGFYTQKL